MNSTFYLSSYNTGNSYKQYVIVQFCLRGFQFVGKEDFNETKLDLVIAFGSHVRLQRSESNS
ncbi:hypothetical protein GCM10007416_35230 [Kroppenstedtia guangzhouensis]|uniref:Uncharacterized protein n=1 Tax=Kroppenstedtia guangzhouensis TaxID=1274356 RepID=A0ABQ1H522_9BACL|nr:hypothetical protein GCM10007416_35230 [Kroppenstedtia guangzhouensis]